MTLKLTSCESWIWELKILELTILESTIFVLINKIRINNIRVTRLECRVRDPFLKLFESKLMQPKLPVLHTRPDEDLYSLLTLISVGWLEFFFFFTRFFIKGCLVWLGPNPLTVRISMTFYYVMIKC